MDSLFNLLNKQISFTGQTKVKDAELLWCKDPNPPVKQKHVECNYNPDNKILTVKKPKINVELEEANVSQYGNEFVIKVHLEDEDKGNGILKFKVKRLYI